MTRHDVVIIGAGLVGLATAFRLTQLRPSIDIIIVDKELGVAAHQSGHNSGVLHSGLYYDPGSLRARLCREGRAQLESFALEHGIQVLRTGKLVIATSDSEVSRLRKLSLKGMANGLQGLEEVDRQGLLAYEPEVAGCRGLWVPETSVIDFGLVARTLESDLRGVHVKFLLGDEVIGIRENGQEVTVRTRAAAIVARRLVNCAGLHAVEVARMAGHQPNLMIVPFRGDYFNLAPAAAQKVRGLIYPVPDPRMPFLGVHLTRHSSGVVSAGPNAVLALHPEGYSRADVSMRHLLSLARSPGFRRLARRYAGVGLAELWRDLSVSAYARSVRSYLPSISRRDLRPGGSGVRAQAVGKDGSLIDDFVLQSTKSAVHVLNAPSPAATACLAIGSAIAAEVLRLNE